MRPPDLPECAPSLRRMPAVCAWEGGGGDGVLLLPIDSGAESCAESCAGRSLGGVSSSAWLERRRVRGTHRLAPSAVAPEASNDVERVCGLDGKTSGEARSDISQSVAFRQGQGGLASRRTVGGRPGLGPRESAVIVVCYARADPRRACGGPVRCQWPARCGGARLSEQS